VYHLCTEDSRRSVLYGCELKKHVILSFVAFIFGFYDMYEGLSRSFRT